MEKSETVRGRWIKTGVYRESSDVEIEARKITREDKIEEEGKMSVRWETEGLQTVGIVCLVIMFLKLMHLLGLIDITETGEMPQEGGSEEEERHGAICECCECV